MHQKVRTTTVYVTHDQVEAMTLADRVVVMNRGTIEQIGAPNDLYHAPATRFVAGFIGSPAMNFIPCRLEQSGDGLTRAPGRRHRARRCRRRAPRATRRTPAATGLTFGLRPEHLTECKPNGEQQLGAVDVMLEVTRADGHGDDGATSGSTGTEVCGRVSPNAGAREGAPMKLAAHLDNMHLIDERPGG